MKTQHTPGPWREVGNFVVASSGSGAICRMAVVGPIKYASEPAGYENAANARLIAAAPDLLAALESLVAIVTEETTKFPANRVIPAGLAVSAAAHAIAKAEGEAHE